MSRKELNATTWKPCQNCNQLWPTVSLKQLPATREKALIAEMSLAQAHSVNEDNRLPEELAELQQKSVSDALDLQLEESKQVCTESPGAGQPTCSDFPGSHVGAIPSTFSDLQRQTKGRARGSSQLGEQNDDLRDRLDSAKRAFEKALEQANPAAPKGQPTPAPSTPKFSPFAIPPKLPRHRCSQCPT